MNFVQSIAVLAVVLGTMAPLGAQVVTYDCTGQQLLDSGTVVINGERAALDLQVAEGKN